MHLEVSQFIEDRWVCSLLELSGVIHGVTAEYEPSLWVFFFQSHHSHVTLVKYLYAD